jgi:hypothetical protein
MEVRRSLLLFNHKNIQFGIKDQQEAKVIHNCSITDREIYEGNTYLETSDGDILQDDIEVLIEKYDIIRRIAGEEVEGE